MLRGLDGMRRHAAARDREEVAELERIARGTLAGMRGLLVRFRSGDDVADGSGARRAGTGSRRRPGAGPFTAGAAGPCGGGPGRGDHRAGAARAPPRPVDPAVRTAGGRRAHAGRARC